MGGHDPYYDFVGNTYADAYAKAMAKRVQVHGAQRAHWRITYKLAYQIMRRLLVVAQHAITLTSVNCKRLFTADP